MARPAGPRPHPTPPHQPLPTVSNSHPLPLQLLHNFIYKAPTAANFSSLFGAVDLLRFLCSRDLTIAQAGAVFRG